MTQPTWPKEWVEAIVTSRYHAVAYDRAAREILSALHRVGALRTEVTRADLVGIIDNLAKIHLEYGVDPYVQNTEEIADAIMNLLSKEQPRLGPR